MVRKTMTPRSAGDHKRKENMIHLEYLIESQKPDGYLRATLIKKYAYDTGLSENKAEEHLDLLLALEYVVEDDLHIFPGKSPRARKLSNIQAEADRLSEIEAKRIQEALGVIDEAKEDPHTHAQKASSQPPLQTLDKTLKDEAEKGNTRESR